MPNCMYVPRTTHGAEMGALRRLGNNKPAITMHMCNVVLIKTRRHFTHVRVVC